MRRVLATLLAAGVLASSVSAAPVRKNSSAPNAPSTKHKINRPYQVGRASWYGKQFDGRSTASGEPFDMFQLTAAHPTLPLGSMVKVTSLRTGHSVVVRINDRGPVVAGRIIDLSYGAAQMLQLGGRGVERVRLDLVDSNTIEIADALN
jgi:rare lipoprotein A